GRPRHDWRRATRMAGKGCCRPLGEHADRADGPPAIVDDLRAVGLGHRGRGPRARLYEALRLGDRAQRPHPPDHPESRREHHIPYREVDGIPDTGSGHRPGSRPNEGATRRGASQIPRHTDGKLRTQQGRSRPDRQHARRLKGIVMLRPIFNPAPRRRRITLLLGAVGVASLLTAALPGLTGAGEAVVAAAANPAAVQIDNFAFTPATLTVTAGTTVTWKNDDDSPHRIGDKNGTFKSAALDTDDSFSHTFAAPGEYPYICTIHPYMVGKIIVKPGGSSSSN